jgi:hypothetical protein
MSIDITLFEDPAILSKCQNPTQVDFPALKIFYHADDQVVDTVNTLITPRFGGVTLVPIAPQALLRDTLGIFMAADPLSYLISSGTWPSLAGSSALVPFVIGVCSSSGTISDLLNFGVGQVSSGGFGFSAVGASAVNTDVTTGSTNIAMTVPTASTEMASVACLDITGNLVYRAKGVLISPEQSMAASSATPVGASVTGLPGSTLTQSVITPFDASNGSQKARMFGVLAFTQARPNIATILAASRWMAKHKGIYPGFLGLS